MMNATNTPATGCGAYPVIGGTVPTSKQQKQRPPESIQPQLGCVLLAIDASMVITGMKLTLPQHQRNAVGAKYGRFV